MSPADSHWRRAKRDAWAYTHSWARIIAISIGLTMFASLTLADCTLGLPDARVYELVTSIRNNGLSPYAAFVSTNGLDVDYQARGAFAGATLGSLNLYKATRTSGGWQTVPLTPAPTTPLGSLEEQAPVWISQDLSKAIFTTPESYNLGDQDHGSLSLYEQTPKSLEWVSQGTQGAGEPDQTTFDTATPDGTHVIFSTAASLLPAATGLNPATNPEPEFLYERDVTNNHTNLISLDSNSRPAGYAETTLAEEYAPGSGGIIMTRAEGFAPGQFITVGAGPSAETTQIASIERIEGTTEEVSVNNGRGLASAFPVGTQVVHRAEGAVLGDGGHLTAGLPPAGEFLPADAGSGSTTNAISNDGSKVFFEAPNPSTDKPVSLFMRHGNFTTKIAGGSPYATIIAEAFSVELAVFGSARFEGAAADGSLVFFSSEEGLAGATKGKEVYEFNATNHTIGGVAPTTVSPVSAGMGGDQAPATTLAVGVGDVERITVASTAGFHAGEEILFGPFELSRKRVSSDETAVIASVDSATELTLTGSLTGASGSGIPAGDEVHGVHPASFVAMANDGSRVFFESNGVLASNENTQGSKAAPAEPNLYAFDTGTGETTFIATLAEKDVVSEGNPAGLIGEPDISRPAVPSPDGSVLVFASAGNLTDQNPWEEFKEIYRYSSADGSLICVTCTPPGVKPTGDASFGETAGGTYDPPGLTSPMSENGDRVFFQTPDSLVPEDANGGAPTSAKFGTPTSTDVYEWENGKVSLISGGDSSNPTVLQGTTPSGDDVLFTSTSQLVPGQSDGGYENVFDARVGGGFPAAAGGGAPSCVGSGCRAAFGAPPVFAAPASASPQSPGADPPAVKPKPLTCRNGLVKKHVKGKVVCARKAKKAGRASRAAGLRNLGVNAGRAR